MKKTLIILLAVLITILSACTPANTTSGNESDISAAVSEPVENVDYYTFRLEKETIRDRILGSWIGQAVGVVWGADQEFWYCNQLMPDDKVPDITTLNFNNCSWQDDLYVEIPFMSAMIRFGVDCSIAKIANVFRDTTFGLDHANKAGRENLRNGIKAPDSGSYLYNTHCDDIDWQIEADFLGCIYPGDVGRAVERAFELGHITNYGDGVYGGVFVAAMHASAFTAKSVREIIDDGINAIPEGTKFRDVMNDVLAWYEAGDTWQECWQKLIDKWDKTSRCLALANNPANIDAKMNSAFILIGLLYGEGDFEDSMRISMQCGHDSDCNPSSVGGILGNWYGAEALDEIYKKIDFTGLKFSYTDMTFADAVEINCKLAYEAITGDDGDYKDKEYFDITIALPENATAPFEQWPAGPTLDARVDCDGGAIVRMYANAHDISGIKSVKWDMGDGTVYGSDVSAHFYKATGDYTVKCTVTSNEDKTVEKTVNVTVTKIEELTADPQTGYHNLMEYGYPICTDFVPTGSGSMDINVIRDGKKSGSNTDQYDTYVGYVPVHDDHIGYLFLRDYTVDKIVFTEGMHFNNGGWFANGTLRVELLIDGSWVEVDSECLPEYPNGNTQASFGGNFTTYTFTFDKTECNGARIIGTAGGDAGFVSVIELEVWGE